MEIGDITVQRWGDALVLDGVWPEWAAIDDELLNSEDLDPNVLWRKDGLLFFRLTNAEAVYEITNQRWSNTAQVIHLQRQEI